MVHTAAQGDSMAYAYETFTVELDRTYASGHMGGAKIIGQHDLDTALNAAAARGSEVYKIVAGPDYVLVILRRGDAAPDGDE
jgi:hypothetical protein